MKIIALAKHVPNTEAVIKISSDKKSYDKSDFKYTMNPCDEYAVEQAVRTQEKFQGESVVVTLGDADCMSTIRVALAMGIDRAIWINTTGFTGDIDSFIVASALAKVIEKEKPDVVFAGLNTTDEGSGNVGPMLAEMLSIPSLLNVSVLEWNNDGTQFTANRDVEGGIVEVYQASLPALIAPHQNLNTPRFTSLPNIMKAKKKPVEEASLAELSKDVKNRCTTLELSLPAEKPAAKIFKGQPVEQMCAEVVKLLRSEAKVI